MANYVKSWLTFAEVTTIHGIHDLVFAKAKLVKVLWAIVLVGSMGLLATQLYQAIKVYHDGATYFLTSVKMMDSYPPFRIIPVNALDFAKAQQLGLNADHFCFLLGYFRDRYKNANYFNKNQLYLDQLEKEINAIGRANNMSTVFDLAEYLAYDPEEFLKLYQWNSPDVDLTASKVIDTHGVSYEIMAAYNQNATSSLSKMQNYGKWSMTIYDLGWNDGNIHCSLPGGDMLRRGVTFMIAIGDDHWDPDRWISIRPTSTVQMTLQVSEKHLISKPNTPGISSCQKGTTSMMKCTLDCMAPILYLDPDSYNGNCSTDGTIYFTEDTGRVGKFYNSWYDHTNRSNQCNQNITNQMEECVKDCKEPCQKRSFIVNTKEIYYNIDPVEGLTVTRFHVNMESGWVMELIEEDYVYTPLGLISNIGGLMGLFAGASVISILQLMAYAIFGSWLEKESAKTTPQDEENRKN